MISLQAFHFTEMCSRPTDFLVDLWVEVTYSLPNEGQSCVGSVVCVAVEGRPVVNGETIKKMELIWHLKFKIHHHSYRKKMESVVDQIIALYEENEKRAYTDGPDDGKSLPNRSPAQPNKCFQSSLIRKFQVDH